MIIKHNNKNEKKSQKKKGWQCEKLKKGKKCFGGFEIKLEISRKFLHFRFQKK